MFFAAMTDVLSIFRKIFGYRDDTNYITSRKRRFMSEDYENFSTKLRRRNEKKMNSDDWLDGPSTSRKSLLKYPYSRQTIRPLSIRSVNTDVVDISDDEEIVEITPLSRRTALPLETLNGNFSRITTRRSNACDVLQKAKRTMEKYNKMFNGTSKANETIRLDEQQTYRNMLLHSPTTAAVYNEDNLSNPSTVSKRLFQLTELQNRRKLFSQQSEKKVLPTIDLTDEKSSRSGKESLESDVEVVSIKRKVEPVNSYKKNLDTQPFMCPSYLTKLDERYRERTQTTKRFIQEEKEKVNKFSSLNHDNVYKLLTEKVNRCKITEVILLDEYQSSELILPTLTDEQEAKIKEALNSRSQNRIFAEKFNLRISGTDLKCFNEKEWLNDEVINFYVNLIQERSHRPGLPKVYSFSTFFYPKLISNGFTSLRRWTKRVDIFGFDIIVVPVHLGFHWCMAIIDFRDKSIRYYDSMRGNNLQCLAALENYLQEESFDKKKCQFDTSDWQKVVMKDIPRQMNGSDCGVFSCTFAEFVSRDAKILFTQEHMPYIRRKMVIEIIEGHLLT